MRDFRAEGFFDALYGRRPIGAVAYGHDGGALYAEGYDSGRAVRTDMGYPPPEPEDRPFFPGRMRQG